MNPDDPLSLTSKKYGGNRQPAADRRSARRASSRAGGETHQVRRKIGYDELAAAQERRERTDEEKTTDSGVNLFFPTF